MKPGKEMHFLEAHTVARKPVDSIRCELEICRKSKRFNKTAKDIACNIK